MTSGEEIKLLREKSGWSQDGLAQKIKADDKQISRYENGKFLPSACAIIKLTQIFNMSINYSPIDNTLRKQLHFNDKILVRNLQDI